MDKMNSFLKIFFRLGFTAGILLFLSAAGTASGEVVPSYAAGGASDSGRWFAYAAMGSVAVSCLASAYALSKIGAAAMGAMSEKPELGGRALIFLGMAEGIAIYGLIIAIMLVNKI